MSDDQSNYFHQKHVITSISSVARSKSSLLLRFDNHSILFTYQKRETIVYVCPHVNHSTLLVCDKKLTRISKKKEKL